MAVAKIDEDVWGDADAELDSGEEQKDACTATSSPGGLGLGGKHLRELKVYRGLARPATLADLTGGSLALRLALQAAGASEETNTPAGAAPGSGSASGVRRLAILAEFDTIEQRLGAGREVSDAAAVQRFFRTLARSVRDLYLEVAGGPELDTFRDLLFENSTLRSLVLMMETPTLPALARWARLPTESLAFLMIDRNDHLGERHDHGPGAGYAEHRVSPEARAERREAAKEHWAAVFSSIRAQEAVVFGPHNIVLPQPAVKPLFATLELWSREKWPRNHEQLEDDFTKALIKAADEEGGGFDRDHTVIINRYGNCLGWDRWGESGGISAHGFLGLWCW